PCRFRCAEAFPIRAHELVSFANVPKSVPTRIETAPGEFSGGRFASSGDRIRTCDLWVMSPASYRAAPPRVGKRKVTQRRGTSPNRESATPSTQLSSSVRRRIQPVPPCDVVHPGRRPVGQAVLVGEFAE